MAARSLVISEILCYLSNKYGNIDSRKISSVIVDFYKPVKINDAKEILVKYVEDMNLTDKWPKPTRRRDSDLNARALKEVQDIIQIWSYLDGNSLIGNLPIFVAADLSAVPSAKLEDGDMQYLLRKLDNIEQAVIENKKAINDFRAAFSISSFKTLDLVPIPTGMHGDKISAGNSKPPGVSDDDECWTIAGGRVKKRFRGTDHISSSPASQSTSGILKNDLKYNGSQYRDSLLARPVLPTANPSSANRGKQVMKLVGRATTGLTNIRAVKDLTRKKVFCVSNVDPNCSEESMKTFISSMGVRVLSLHTAKNNFKIAQKSFRVCINAEDLSAFCNADNWFENARIREWVWKSAISDTSNQDGGAKANLSQRSDFQLSVGNHSNSVESVQDGPAVPIDQRMKSPTRWGSDSLDDKTDVTLLAADPTSPH